MNRNALLLALSTGLAALTGYAQQNQPQGEGTPSRQTLPPGLQNREQLPPGLQKRDANNDDTVTNAQAQADNFSESTNAPGSQTGGVRSGLTNSFSRFGSNLNRWSTNLFGRSSSTNQGLTSRGPDTNRVYQTNGGGNALSRFGSNASRFSTNLYARATNYFSTNHLLSPTGSGTNRAYPATRGGSTRAAADQAVTAKDRTLLVSIRQQLQATLKTQVQVPFHFICREGVVTVTGYAASPQEKEQCLMVVQQTPGVVQVVDQIEVSAQTSTAVGGATEAQYTGQGQYSSHTPEGSVTIQDQGLTSSDQALLVQLRGEIAPVVGAEFPIHLVCRNGIVTIVGLVANNEQQHQVVDLVRRTPGVVQVFDKLEVSLNAAGAVTTSSTAAISETNAAGLSNAAAVTIAGTNISAANTNLAPTSRPDQENRVFEGDDRRVPPGLQKHDRVPPGQQERENLPSRR